eukprot:352201-Chlamydomonas_euryale.AAC.4
MPQPVEYCSGTEAADYSSACPSRRSVSKLESREELLHDQPRLEHVLTSKNLVAAMHIHWQHSKVDQQPHAFLMATRSRKMRRQCPHLVLGRLPDGLKKLDRDRLPQDHLALSYRAALRKSTSPKKSEQDYELSE